MADLMIMLDTVLLVISRHAAETLKRAVAVVEHDVTHVRVSKATKRPLRGVQYNSTSRLQDATIESELQTS